MVDSTGLRRGGRAGFRPKRSTPLLGTMKLRGFVGTCDKKGEADLHLKGSYCAVALNLRAFCRVDL